jgi:hypothetical protein
VRRAGERATRGTAGASDIGVPPSGELLTTLDAYINDGVGDLFGAARMTKRSLSGDI